MKEALEDLLHDLRETYVDPRVHRVKQRVLLSLVTAVSLALFILLGFVCLFLMVFLGLTQKYDDPQTAAVILFGFCVVICLGIVVIHAIVRRVEDKASEARFTQVARQHATRPSRQQGPSVAELAREYFADHKVPGLLSVAAAGLLLGARPGLVFKALGLVLRRRSRERY